MTGEEKFRYTKDGKEYVVTVDENGELRRYENGTGRGYKITQNGLERILANDVDALAKFHAAFGENATPSDDTKSDENAETSPTDKHDDKVVETPAEHVEQSSVADTPVADEAPVDADELQTTDDAPATHDTDDANVDDSTIEHDDKPIQEVIPGLDTPSGSEHAAAADNDARADKQDEGEVPDKQSFKAVDGQMAIDFNNDNKTNPQSNVEKNEQPTKQAAPIVPQQQFVQQQVPPQQQYQAVYGGVQQPVYPQQPAQKKPKKPKKPVTFGKAVAGGAIGCAVVLAIYTGIGLYGYHATGMDKSDTTTSNTSSSKGISKSASNEDSSLATQVAAKAVPSVASITVSNSGASSTDIANSSGSGSIGSGVLIDKDGNILTNYHVVEYADGNNGYSITAKLGDKSYEAKIVGKDKSSDLAVIKVDAGNDNLTPIDVGSSDDLQVGDWVMSIGSPFGNEQSVSTGIVSAKSRDITMSGDDGSTSFYSDMIQTDAAINPGNSGGALVNEKGQLVGINSIIESSSQSSAGVGFAIPSDYAIDVANTLISGKKVEHPRIGATVGTVTPQMSKKLGLGNGAYGAYVNSVSKDSPADKAGIKKGDVITKIDGEQVDAATTLITDIRSHKVGDKVTLTILRDGKEQDLEVELTSDSAIKDDDENSNENSGDGNSSNSMEDSPYSNLQQRLLEFLEEQQNGGSNQGNSDGLNGFGTRRNG